MPGLGMQMCNEHGRPEAFPVTMHWLFTRSGAARPACLREAGQIKLFLIAYGQASESTGRFLVKMPDSG